MLRIFHDQWSGYEDPKGPVRDTSDDGTVRRSPREIFPEQLEEWTLAWGFEAYRELDKLREAQFVDEGFPGFPYEFRALLEETTIFLVLLSIPLGWALIL